MADEKTYHIVFYALHAGHKYADGHSSLPGHVFVGYYENHVFQGIKGFSPGAKPDLNENEYLKEAEHGLAFQVSEEQYNQAKSISSKNYLAGLNDCVTYADKVAERIGLNTGSILDGIISPIAFLDNLAARNKPDSSFPGLPQHSCGHNQSTDNGGGGLGSSLFGSLPSWDQVIQKLSDSSLSLGLNAAISALGEEGQIAMEAYDIYSKLSAGNYGAILGKIGKPAACLGDITEHGTPLGPGPGSFNVLIGFRPAWRGIPNPGAAEELTMATAAMNVAIASATAAANAAMASGNPGAAALKAAEQSLMAMAKQQLEAQLAKYGVADKHICPKPTPTPPHGMGVVVDGTPTVLINYLPACRMLDSVLEPLGGLDRIATGNPTVLIGGGGGNAAQRYPNLSHGGTTGLAPFAPSTQPAGTANDSVDISLNDLTHTLGAIVNLPAALLLRGLAEICPEFGEYLKNNLPKTKFGTGDRGGFGGAFGGNNSDTDDAGNSLPGGGGTPGVLGIAMGLTHLEQIWGDQQDFEAGQLSHDIKTGSHKDSDFLSSASDTIGQGLGILSKHLGVGDEFNNMVQQIIGPSKDDYGFSHGVGMGSRENSDSKTKKPK